MAEADWLYNLNPRIEQRVQQTMLTSGLGMQRVDRAMEMIDEALQGGAEMYGVELVELYYLLKAARSELP